MHRTTIRTVATVLIAIMLFGITACENQIDSITTADQGTVHETEPNSEATTCPETGEVTGEHTTHDDDTGEPGTDNPVTIAPDTDAPETGTHGSTQTNEPVTDEPGTDTPETSVPDTDEPDGTTEQTVTIPVTTCTHNYKTTVTAPTCTEDGYTTHTCTKCKESYKDTVVKATGHKYTDTTVAATCSKDGYVQHKCSVCGYTTKDVIKTKGHDYKAGKVVASTCTEQGYTVFTCTKCGASYNGAVKDALGHSYGDWVTTIQPTETTNGKQTRTCSRCGHQDIRDVDATGQVITFVDNGDHTRQGFWLDDGRYYLVVDYRTWGELPVMKRVGDNAVVTWNDKNGNPVEVTMKMPDESTWPIGSYMGVSLTIKDDGTWYTTIVYMGGAG